MSEVAADATNAAEAVETQEWLESLEYVLGNSGPERVRELLVQLQNHARRHAVSIPFATNTPYANTIPPERQPAYPGSHDLERRIRNIVRWNAMIMVVRANQDDPTIGGHCGDANGDGGVTSADGFHILNHFGDPITFPVVSCWAANVNGDGGLTTADGYHLLNYLGDPETFPLTCGFCIPSGKR